MGGVSLRSVSLSLLDSAALYELPHLRSELLPAAWRYVQVRLPPASAASHPVARDCLAFLASVTPPDTARAAAAAAGRPAAGGPTGIAADGGARDGSEPTSYFGASAHLRTPTDVWAPLLGAAGGGAPLPINPRARREVATALRLAARLPPHAVPAAHVGWLLPAALVLVQLSLGALSPPSQGSSPTRPKGQQPPPQQQPGGIEDERGEHDALAVAALGFVACLCAACPAVGAALPPPAATALLQWCHALPSVLAPSLVGPPASPQPRALWLEALNHAGRVVYFVSAGGVNAAPAATPPLTTGLLPPSGAGSGTVHAPVWVSMLRAALLPSGDVSRLAAARWAHAAGAQHGAGVQSLKDNAGRRPFSSPGGDGNSEEGGRGAGGDGADEVGAPGSAIDWAAAAALTLLGAQLDALLSCVPPPAVPGRGGSSRADANVSGSGGYGGGGGGLKRGVGKVAEEAVCAQIDLPPVDSTRALVSCLRELHSCFNGHFGEGKGGQGGSGEVPGARNVMAAEEGRRRADGSGAGGGPNLVLPILGLLSRAAAAAAVAAVAAQSGGAGGSGPAAEGGGGLSAVDCRTLAALLDVTSLWLRSCERLDCWCERLDGWEQLGCSGPPPPPPNLRGFLRGLVCLMQARVRGGSPLGPPGRVSGAGTAGGAEWASRVVAEAARDGPVLARVDASLLRGADALALCFSTSTGACLTTSDGRRLAALLLLLTRPLAAGLRGSPSVDLNGGIASAPVLEGTFSPAWEGFSASPAPYGISGGTGASSSPVPLLGPSGRLLPAAEATPVGSLRRMVAAADDEMFVWLLDGVIAELRGASGRPSATASLGASAAGRGAGCPTLLPPSRRYSSQLVSAADGKQNGAAGAEHNGGRLPAALVCAALLCASSSPLHLARLSASLPRLLPMLCEIAISAGAGEAAGGAWAAAAADGTRRAALQVLTALVTNDQLRFELEDSAGLMGAAGSACAGITPHSRPMEWSGGWAVGWTGERAPLQVSSPSLALAQAGPWAAAVERPAGTSAATDRAPHSWGSVVPPPTVPHPSHPLPAVSPHLQPRSPVAPLPSAQTFSAAYFFLLALLRQRAALVHSSVPLFLTALRGMMFALGWARATAAHARSPANRLPNAPAPHVASAEFDEAGASSFAAGGRGCAPAVPAAPAMDLESVRHVRRLLEAAAGHRRSLLRYGAYLLSDAVALLRHRPLAPAAHAELLPGVHALIGMCTQIELQELHAGLDHVGKRVLAELLDGYQSTYRFRG